MKAYVRPMMTVEPLAMNPHWEEASYGSWWQIDHTIPAGDVDLQVKGTQEVWGDLWE